MSVRKVSERKPTFSDSGDLTLLLRDHSQDEKGGVNANAGISYQQWWAALKATELYSSSADFLIGVEFKEDVFVLDSPGTPSTIQFYQIKKYEKEGAWNWSALLNATTHKDKTVEPSPIAKLYSRRNNFSGYSTKLSFISNVSFKVPLETGKLLQLSSKCELNEFISEKAEVVKAKIADQLNMPKEAVDLSNISLERTDLPLGRQDVFLTGTLSILSDSGKLPFRITKPYLSARMLAVEFQQKASKTDFANTYEKLKQRCLTRSDVTRILSEVESMGPTNQALLENGIARLEREGFHFGKVEQIKREKVNVCANMSDRTNASARRIHELLTVCGEEIGGKLEECEKFGEAIEMLIVHAYESDADALTGFSDGYIRAVAILVILNERDTNEQALAAYSQSEEGN